MAYLRSTNSTGVRETGWRCHARTAGYITKPFQVNSLVKAVKAVLGLS